MAKMLSTALIYFSAGLLCHNITSKDEVYLKIEFAKKNASLLFENGTMRKNSKIIHGDLMEGKLVDVG